MPLSVHSDRSFTLHPQGGTLQSTRGATPVVLTIAGSDSSAGAGIAADLKTGGAFGVYVCTAITAVTAQNSFSVQAISCVDAGLLREQIEAVCEAHPPQAVKLGMLGNEANFKVVCDYISRVRAPVVIDPVFGATSGASLWPGEHPAELYRAALLPHATLLTPNLAEAAALLGGPLASNYSEMEQQALELKALGPAAVLLKGGHLQGDQAPDCLVETDLTTPFTVSRVRTAHTHGSGCTLATAIAAGLAQGLALKQAVAAAKSYVSGALTNAQRLNLVESNGPLHHFFTYW